MLSHLFLYHLLAYIFVWSSQCLLCPLWLLPLLGLLTPTNLLVQSLTFQHATDSVSIHDSVSGKCLYLVFHSCQIWIFLTVHSTDRESTIMIALATLVPSLSHSYYGHLQKFNKYNCTILTYNSHPISHFGNSHTVAASWYHDLTEGDQVGEVYVNVSVRVCHVSMVVWPVVHVLVVREAGVAGKHLWLLTGKIHLFIS